MLKAVLISLVAGGFITSTFEFFFQYNLIDLLKDKVLGLFGKAKSEAKAVVVDAEKKL